MTSPPAQSDNELIARVIARGDQHAFSELVKRHQSTLRASLRKMTNGQLELSDDIAQETFILAWKNIGKFGYEAKFSTWLYRIAFNAWQSDVRRKSEVLMDEVSMPEPTSIDSNGRKTPCLLAFRLLIRSCNTMRMRFLANLSSE